MRKYGIMFEKLADQGPHQPRTTDCTQHIVIIIIKILCHIEPLLTFSFIFFAKFQSRLLLFWIVLEILEEG